MLQKADERPLSWCWRLAMTSRNAILIQDIEIHDKVGAGHFGTVYRGMHPVHGEVAVKTISRSKGMTDNEWEEKKAEWLSEGKRLSAARHRNVLPVHAVCAEASDDSVHLITDFCRDGSLEKHYLNRPCTVVEVRDWALDIAQGLAAIHARGLLHRDIKPANVLLKDGRAVLGDFGLVTDDIVGGYGSLKGYTDHVAPEVFASSLTTVKSDVWAFGMTLYRLLHGDIFLSTKRSAF